MKKNFVIALLSLIVVILGLCCIELYYRWGVDRQVWAYDNVRATEVAEDKIQLKATVQTLRGEVEQYKTAISILEGLNIQLSKRPTTTVGEADVEDFGSIILVSVQPITTTEVCQRGCISGQLEYRTPDGFLRGTVKGQIVELISCPDGWPHCEVHTALMNDIGKIRWIDIPANSKIFIVHPLTGNFIPENGIDFTQSFYFKEGVEPHIEIRWEKNN